MDKPIFVINAGSESKKYALAQNGEVRGTVRFETAGRTFLMQAQKGSEKRERTANAEEFGNALALAAEEFVKMGLIGAFPEDVAMAAMRVVAPGAAFSTHRLVDAAYEAALADAERIEPLHVRPVLAEIRALRALAPHLHLIAASDSAFHSGMPRTARLYGIPREDAGELIRFGYHGLSFASIARALPDVFGKTPQRAILCHLGGGGSIAALRDGKSIDTSMGYTPLEGLLMATRPGDVDAGLVLSLVRRFNGDADKLEAYLYGTCGLAGLSGKTGDIRELLRFENEGHAAAADALAVYVYRIQKYIGSYAAALGGLDALVFSGTVGERSFVLRGRICRSLGFLGVELDGEKNGREIESSAALLEAGSSKVRIAVIPTDEMGEIARAAAALH